MSSTKINETEKIANMICPECGSGLIDYKSRVSVGVQCPKCNFSILRTWSPLDDYPYDYEIKVLKPADMNSVKYKALSKFPGKNYLELKKLPAGTKFFRKFNIYDAWNMIEFLDQSDVEYIIEPEFPFTSREEMKEKLMLDDF